MPDRCPDRAASMKASIKVGGRLSQGGGADIVDLDVYPFNAADEFMFWIFV
jgi:hypothetical protein